MRLAFLLVMLVLGGCGDFLNGNTPLDTLRRNRERWEAFGVRDYDFDFHRSCECLTEATIPVRIEVRAGDISRVLNLSTGEPLESSGTVFWPTIDSLFVWTERSFLEGYGLEVIYDVEHRFPTRVVGDLAGVVDDEYVHVALNLVRR